jgi:plasmid stabilization system protein ParE
MQYELILLEDASREIEEAIVWYESQKQGLSTPLMAVLRKTMNLLGTNPTIFAKVYEEVRRVLLSKFPYTLYYIIDEETQTVVVFAFLHQSRNPDNWKKRINKE